MDHCVLPLFSYPLYCTQIDVRNVPDWNTIDWDITAVRDKSKTNRILNEPGWNNIQAQILAHIKKFFYEHLKASPDIEIEITTSLVNRNLPGHNHPRHTHSNSILSGCLYFDFHPAGIKFIRSGFPGILWDKTEFNLNNSDEWTVNPEPGLLLIWPSGLEHQVEHVKHTDPVRYSLAFNTWIRGKINSVPELELEIL